MMRGIRVVVADDHPIFLDGLCQLLKIRHPDIVIAASASDGLQAVELCRRLRPDVLLVDIRMPIMNGIRAAEILKAELPAIKIVVLTTFDERNLITSAMKAGADGYLLKEASVDHVAEGVRLVVRGTVLLSSKVARSVDGMSTDAPDTTRAAYSDGQIAEYEEGVFDTADDQVPALKEMTAREREVFRLVICNYSNEMIARELSISERTVRNYVSKIYELTGKHNRSSLIIWAMKRNLIG